MRLQLTASQTVGPFFSFGLLRPDATRNVVAPPGTAGERIRVEGRVLDGEGAPVPDGLVEIWQANAGGRYKHPLDQREIPLDPAFTGFGRSGTDDAGRFWFETIKPGAVPGANGGTQALHLVVTLFTRGILNHVVTRMYFADDPATESDVVLGRVPADRRGTLLAQPTHANGKTVYHWDVVMQGAGETAFMNV